MSTFADKPGLLSLPGKLKAENKHNQVHVYNTYMHSTFGKNCDIMMLEML